MAAGIAWMAVSLYAVMAAGTKKRLPQTRLYADT
jgi:hypothetical protein